MLMLLFVSRLKAFFNLYIPSFFILFSSASFSQVESEKVLHFITSHSPPGEYLNEKNEVVGATVDLIRLLSSRQSEHIFIELLPWARASKMAQKTANSVLFETIRTEDRENKFQWVGPLKQYQMSLYGLKDTLKQKSDKALIACELRGSVHQDKLLQIGFKEGVNLVLTTQGGDCIEMMAKGRVHLSTFSDWAVEHDKQILKHNLDLMHHQFLYTIELYLAFSLDVDPLRVERWKRALELSYLDGSMRSLYQGIYPDYQITRLEQWAQEHSPLAKEQ
ncbi:substrate-binding periplasmic protein [Arsukibacterium sp.]|uniref:substrate-binding periplasmic protein n=1 Tax=Arsukibacterium sp. TaxID=1977258 RepID=UPI002FDAD80B